MKSTYNFKPFDKVLVRNDDNWKWNGELFLRYVEDNKFQYECLTTSYSQCIPYEGNEHLLGTTDNPEQQKQTFTKAEIAKKLNMNEQDFEIVK